ncbi:MAG: TIGR02450 family Trp-rich protein [Zetaproteobacteria bacterium]|nr:TIGR02450 family Trp-rich protein [Pseudobdellovibrionaceae bacterium]
MSKKRNNKNLDINSNWTSQKQIRGWKHFRISGRAYQNGILQIELMAVCDRDVTIWIDASNLAKNDQWQPGWL